MVKVSVIIPVYNGERHLRQCLDSVCNQTLREIEIICVDDGSTDGSYAILQEYARKDSRIKVMQQQNLYAGTARNRGKAQAQGEYLAFWDCDDYFELECLELMYEKATEQQADICVCGGNQYFEDQDLEVISPRHLDEKMLPEQEVFSMEDIPEYILNFTCIPAWNKIYKRSFVEAQKLDFQPIRNGNDVYFTMNALCLAQSVTTVRKHLVYYRTNQNSSLVGTMTKRPLDIINTWMLTAEHLIEKNRFPERSFANRSLESMIYLLQHLTDWDSFSQAVGLLKKEGLEKLHIRDGGEEYYYIPLHQEFAKHLLEDKPEDLLVYMANSNYERFRVANAQKRTANLKLKKRNAKIKTLQAQNEQLQEEIERLKEEAGKKKGLLFFNKNK